MGIQSTVDYQRSGAIERVSETFELILDRDYRKLDERAYELDYSVYRFVDAHIVEVSALSSQDLNKWTNDMLERWMDKPFFRQSPFENYNVVGD